MKKGQSATSYSIKSHPILEHLAISYRKLNPFVKTGLVFALLFIGFWLISWYVLDPDFGWHLRTGYYIRSHGIPAHDMYTYTAKSYRWVDHEWGNDVIVSLLYGAGGYALVGLMYALLWAGSLIIAGAEAGVLTLVIAALALTPYAGSRPLAWTVFGFALTLSILKSSKRRLIWMLPFVFLLWANLHAGFIAGLAALAYFAIREHRRSLFYVLVLSLLVTFINPYGLRLYGEIAHTIFDPALHSQIVEWAYVSFRKVSLLFVCIWLIGFWMFDGRRWQRWLNLSPLLLVAALSSSRNLPLFVVAATKDTGVYLDRIKKSIPAKLDRPRRFVKTLIIVVFVGALAYSVYLAYAETRSNNDGLIRSVAYLRQHTCPGNLFNSYNYGGYLIWNLPAQPIYIDGRMPTWRVYMERYMAIISDPKDNYKAEFRRYDIQCALLDSTGSRLTPLLKQAGWKVVIQTPETVLLVSPGAELAKALKPV